MANLLRDWHASLGDDPKDVDREIRGNLKALIVRNFDPDKFGSVFQSSGPPRWVNSMVLDKEWRDLLYELAEKFPKNEFMNFALELCKDKVGLEAQKAGTETASSNLKIFDDKLKNALSDMLGSSDNEITPERLGRFTDLACHNEHAFVYVLSVMDAMSRKKRRLNSGSAEGGGGRGGDGVFVDVSRLCQEVRKEALLRGKGRQSEALCNVMNGASRHPEAARAVSAMVCSAKTNVSDINKLHSLYTAAITAHRPPRWVLQHEQLLHLLVQAVFDPKVKISTQHQAKYNWLLAYATCRLAGAEEEEEEEGARARVEESEDFRKVLGHIEEVQRLSKDQNAAVETPESLALLRRGIEASKAVAMGVIEFVGGLVTEAAFYQPGGGYGRFGAAFVKVLEHCVLTHRAQRESLLALMHKVWETSVKLGAEGEPQEKEVAGNLALGITLLLFQVGNSVVVVLRQLQRWSATMTGAQSAMAVTGVLAACVPPFSMSFVKGTLDLLGSVPSMEVLQLDSVCKAQVVLPAPEVCLLLFCLVLCVCTPKCSSQPLAATPLLTLIFRGAPTWLSVSFARVRAHTGGGFPRACQEKRSGSRLGSERLAGQNSSRFASPDMDLSDPARAAGDQWAALCRLKHVCRAPWLSRHQRDPMSEAQASCLG